MIITTSNPEYTNVMHLAFDLVTQLIAGGFKLELSQNYSERVGNRYTATTPGSNAPLDRDLTGLYVLTPTKEVDPLYQVQPWRLIIRVDSYYLNFWATTTKGYYFDEDTKAFSFTRVLDHHSVGLPEDVEGIYSYGSMTENSLFNPELIGGTFFNTKPEYTQFDVLNADPTRSNIDEYPVIENAPITYKLTIGTQGIAFSLWSTQSTNYGNNLAWFVVQRATNYSGAFDPTVGYSALKCVFSQTGGGDTSKGELDALGILQYEVRERDCQLPTMPYSAVLPMYKKKPLINPRKQVCNDEATGMPRVLFMESPCSNRFMSDGFLDLVAYGDASSSVQGEEYTVDLFGDGNLRTYEALCANSPEGEGMRLYIATSGEDVNYSAPQNLNIIFDQKVSNPYGYKGNLIKLNRVKSKDPETGYTETTSADYRFGLRYASGDISKVKRMLVGATEDSLQDTTYAAIPVLGYFLDIWVELEPRSDGTLETIVVETYNLDTGDTYDSWTINISPELAEGKAPDTPNS